DGRLRSAPSRKEDVRAVCRIADDDGSIVEPRTQDAEEHAGGFLYFRPSFCLFSSSRMASFIRPCFVSSFFASQIQPRYMRCSRGVSVLKKPHAAGEVLNPFAIHDGSFSGTCGIES